MMQIDFFEEFPAFETLEKARLITSTCTLYIAARSLKEFLKFKAELSVINPKVTAAYWPILPHSYWLSPFSYPSDIAHLQKELAGYTDQKELLVLFDLELPFLHPWVFLRNCIHVGKNKKNIQKLFLTASKNNISIMTAEYIKPFPLSEGLQRLCGISYNKIIYPHSTISMYYTSMIQPKILKPLFEKLLTYEIKKNPTNTSIGLGTIAKGVFQHEPILHPDDLRHDIRFLSSQGVQHIVVYRLEGLTDIYMQVLTDKNI